MNSPHPRCEVQKSYLQDAVNAQCQHLSDQQQKALLLLLLKLKELFDGTLANWDVEPVKFQLKPEVTPYHEKEFLVLNI